MLSNPSHLQGLGMVLTNHKSIKAIDVIKGTAMS